MQVNVEEIEVAGHKYRVGARRLNCMEQFHVTRRLGPAIVLCGITLQSLLNGQRVAMEDFMSIAGPVMDVVSHMPDEDMEYVIMTCMRTADRLSGGLWAPVLAPDGKRFMFDDMDQIELIHITVAVLRANLENFMKGMNVGGNSSDSSVTTHPSSTMNPPA